MKVTYYVCMGTNAYTKEEEFIGVDSNRSLINIKRDAFLRKNIDWNAVIHTVTTSFEPTWEKRIVLDDEIQDETGIPAGGYVPEIIKFTQNIKTLKEDKEAPLDAEGLREKEEIS